MGHPPGAFHGNSDNPSFQAGQIAGDRAALAQGAVEAAAGQAGVGGGTALTLSVAGAPEGVVAISGGALLEGHGTMAATAAGVHLMAETGSNSGGSIRENAAKGKESETRVLKDIGETKNTKPVEASKGKSIPDFQNEKTVGEIKDAKRVSNTEQLQIQKEAAQQSGREHQLVTGEKTHVTENAGKDTNVVRRDDLGPK